MSCATISIEFIEEARREAENARRDLLPVLEEKTGFVPKEFVKLLADTFGYPSLGMDQLHELVPAFEVLPYTEAQRRECVAFRDGAGELRLVFSDPFNAALLAWAEECIRESFGWYLAHQADIAAYLSLHEETMRASDGVLTEGMTPAGAFGAMIDLSLKSISEDTSPVVKLVNSKIGRAHV